MALTPHIRRFPSLASTNSEAARLALEGAEEGLCIVADEQTAGRGRLQRQWVSPRGAGLYLSILLRPQIAITQWPLITLMAAVAVADTILLTCDVEADIKWPNDVLVNGRKVCGILAETSETPTGRAIVLGIGINLTSKAFPPDLRVNAISLDEATGHGVERETILAELVSTLVRYYELFQQGSERQIIDAWCKRSSYSRGKVVRIASAEETIEGVTRGLQSDGALRVETGNGAIRIIHAGDVSAVRPNEKGTPESQ